MDADRFDALARALAAPRRAFLRALTATGLAAVIGDPAGPGDAAARRRKRATKRRRRCPGGKTRCRKRCVDTGTDEDHCGGCGNACGDAEACCGGTCQNTRSGPRHCGGCAPCPQGQSCVEGACGLGPGTCQDGDDICIPGGTVGCNGIPQCDCVVRFVEGDRVCGRIADCRNLPLQPCGADGDCAASGADAFCARKTGTGCCVNLDVGEGFCARPCGA